MSAVLDDVIKSVKDATDAIKAASESNKAEIQARVEETLKGILANHPGFTPERKIKFEGTGLNDAGEILAAMPKEIQAEMDKIYILSKVLNRNPKDLKSYGKFKRMFDSHPSSSEFRKALDSTTAGQGDEWVPTEMSPALTEKVRLQLKVAGLFPQITMPSNPYQLPCEVGNFSSFLMPENTADTSQTIIPVGDTANMTGNATFTAKAHSTRVLVSKETEEDSIIPILPFIQSRIILSLVQGREDAILNGDTAGTHEDTDTTGATNRRKLFLGLRAISNDQTYKRDLGTMSLANLLLQRGDMGVYGVNPSELVYITSIAGYIKIMSSVTETTTMEKFGPNAVILQGQLASIGGVPLIVSEWVRSDLGAANIYAAASTKTSVYCVNRNAFGVGEKSRPTAQMLRELYSVYNQDAMIVTERVDFQPLFPIASNYAVSVGYNVG